MTQVNSTDPYIDPRFPYMDSNELLTISLYDLHFRL